MAYQWDNNKAASNLNKHGIDFADAVSVFSDDFSTTVNDDRFEEERFITLETTLRRVFREELERVGK